MHFFYDAQSRPAMVEFNGALYSYVHNLQGDIVGIVDSAGSLVVEYKYDAWGKPTLVRTLTTAYEVLAELNPFRYRGYVYDEETGLYYLRSRAYNPVQGRFLLSDVLIVPRRSFRDSNVFAYCGCGPVGNVDIDGNWWLETCIDWVSDNIIEPVVEGVEGVVNSAKEAISNIDFTFSVGININVSVGIWAFNLQGGLSFDSKGNIAVQGSFTGGATTSGEISASAVIYKMLTNAPTIYHLEDLSYQVGGSVSGLPLFGLPIGTLGVELNIIPNTEGGFYKGITWSGGVGVRITEDGFAPSTGVELHAEWGNTKTLAVLRRGSTHLTPEIIPSIEGARISALIEKLKSAPFPI